MIVEWTKSVVDMKKYPQLSATDINNIIHTIWVPLYGEDDIPYCVVSNIENVSKTDGQQIILSPKKMIMPIVLHELAHCLEWKKHGNGEHDMNFVLTVIDLYERYLGISRILMLEQVQKYEL